MSTIQSIIDLLDLLDMNTKPLPLDSKRRILANLARCERVLLAKRDQPSAVATLRRIADTRSRLA